jgi:hypothetical protein
LAHDTLIVAVSYLSRFAGFVTDTAFTGRQQLHDNHRWAVDRAKRLPFPQKRIVHAPLSWSNGMAKRPRDLANQMARQHNLSDGSLHETFTLSIEAARLKAREIIDQFPQGGYTTIVDRWRQLPDGQIEFTMRRLRATAD